MAESCTLSAFHSCGVQGFFMDQNDISMHGRDERMSVKSFYEGQTFLYELVKRQSRAGDSEANSPNN
jgi:acetylornithine deacetylase/succinyl-diaminopimelate desuccinylase-like protein